MIEKLPQRCIKVTLQWPSQKDGRMRVPQSLDLAIHEQPISHGGAEPTASPAIAIVIPTEPRSAYRRLFVGLPSQVLNGAGDFAGRGVGA